jgi:hypothetical protein
MARSITLKNLPDDLHERLRASLPADAMFAIEEIDDFKREGRP